MTNVLTIGLKQYNFKTGCPVVSDINKVHGLISVISLQQVNDVNGDEVEVDIDELLDMDTDEERRRHLQVNFWLTCILISISWDLVNK